MAKKDSTHPLLKEIKDLAKDHQTFEKERGKTLVYGHALDIASKKLLNVDWNTACAMAKNGTLTESNQKEQVSQIPFPQGANSKTFGLVSIHSPEMREGVLFPHQIESMSRQMGGASFDGKSKTLIVPEFGAPLPKNVTDGIVGAFEILGGRGLNTYTGTQSLSDFGLVSEPVYQKVFYSKRNQLMHEYEDLLKDPNYQEIPYEIETVKEMGLWAKNHSGIFFYPTASIADLQNKSDMQVREIIEANFNTMFSITNTNNADHSFILGRTKDAGKSFYRHIDKMFTEIRKFGTKKQNAFFRNINSEFIKDTRRRKR